MHSDEFKAAVGKFPTGIAIITCNDLNTLYGFTANSFTSVSLSPPLISFCLNHSARSIKAFKNSDYFAISILANDQSEISQYFATPKKKDRFQNTSYQLGEASNSALIIGATCWIECSKYQQIDCGDHTIFIGKVEKTKINNDKPPLLYYSKKYWDVT